MTEYKIEVNLAHVPEGTPVELYGLGTYPNGGTYDVPDELVQLHRINNRVYDVNEHGDTINADIMDTLNPQEGVDIYRTDSVPFFSTFTELHNLLLTRNQKDPVDPLSATGSANAPTDAEEGTK